MPRPLQVVEQLLEHLGRRGVEVGDGLGGDDDALHRVAVGSVRDAPQQVVGEEPCVGEEQRCVESVQQQPGHPMSFGVAGEVVVPLQAVDPHELGRVGLPGESQEVQDGQRHRHDHAADRAQDGDREHGRDGEHELAAPHSVEVHHRRDVDQRDRGGHDDGGQGGLGHVAEHARHERAR